MATTPRIHRFFLVLAVLQALPAVNTHGAPEGGVAGVIPDLHEYKSQLLARISEDFAGSADADEAVIETDNDGEVGDAPMHRTNFAASSLGASIMAANNEMTAPKSLLVGDVDAYALSRCDAKKFVVIQLSEDVMPDELLISNEERYSSAVRDFRVTGSLKYPAAEWIVLGNFTAENRFGDQRFSIGVKAFVRFIKVTWLNHYGSEFYCTWTRVQVFGSTLIEDLQSNMHASDAEVQTMKQQLSAAHAAVQQQAAFSTGITSRVQSFEARSNVTASVEPSSLEYSARSMSFVGASGPVTVAVSFWSLHVAGARDLFLVTDEMPGLSTGIKGDSNKSSTGVETMQLCNSSVVDTAAGAASSLSENAGAKDSHAEFSDPTHPIISILSDSDAGQALKPANQTPTVLPPASTAAPSVDSEQPAATRVDDGAIIILDSLLAETTTDAVTSVKSSGLPDVSGALDADFADPATVSDIATNLPNELVVDDAIHVAAATQLAGEPSSASDTVGLNTSAAALADNATAGDNAELEEIARYLDASLEALQSIMTPSSASGMVSVESTSAASSEAIAPATAIATSDSTSSVNRDDALACDDDTRTDRAAGASALSIELNSATASSPASSPAPLQQPATVFKQLTRKLKELEVDQSIMSVYLSDLRTSYSASIAGLQQAVEGIRSAREHGATARDAKLDALAHAVFEMREALSLLYHRHVSLLRRMPAPLAEGAGRDGSQLSIAGNADDEHLEDSEEYELSDEDDNSDDDDDEASSELEKSDDFGDGELENRAMERPEGVHGKAPTSRRSAAPGPTQTRRLSAPQLSPSPTPALARCDAESELLELSKEFRDMIEAVSSVPGAREVEALVGTPEGDVRGRAVKPVAAVFLPTSSLAALLSIEQLRDEWVADSAVDSESSVEPVSQTVHSDDALDSPLSSVPGQTVSARAKHGGASPASAAAGAELRVLRRRLELIEERLEAAAAWTSIFCGSVAVGAIVIGLAIGQATATRR